MACGISVWQRLINAIHRAMRDQKWQNGETLNIITMLFMLGARGMAI